MSNLQELETAIKDAIASIREGNSTPSKSGIGPMFKDMRGICPETHARLMSEYKPVSLAFFAAKPRKDDKRSKIEKQLARIEGNLYFGEDDFDDNGDLLPEVRAKAIEDACRRIEGKKKKTPAVKKDPNAPRIRDRRGYEFNGEVYGKGPLVLAVIRHHVENNPDINYNKLKSAFPDELLKSYGIFKRLDQAQEASKKRKRYFLKETQLVSVGDCKVAVCNQFTSSNIGAFLEKAREMGYEIKEQDG